ncbi:putative Zn-binding protein involved in type VI secretion [Oxalobacteraceae bacterium GrIS 1.11]
MSRPICCEGDATSHGGKVVQASGSFTIDGRRIARVGDTVSCPRHGDNKIVEGDGTSLDEGIPIALHGHHGACGCALICTVNATIAA